MNLRLRGLALLVSIAVFGTVATSAQPAIQPTVDITRIPAAAQPSPSFNVNDATEAYMAMMPPAAVERSNAYFEGGYWLILWDFLYASAVCLIVLNTRWTYSIGTWSWNRSLMEFTKMICGFFHFNGVASMC